jgi:hypothetical protein
VASAQSKDGIGSSGDSPAAKSDKQKENSQYKIQPRRSSLKLGESAKVDEKALTEERYSGCRRCDNRYYYRLLRRVHVNNFSGIENRKDHESNSANYSTDVRNETNQAR